MFINLIRPEEWDELNDQMEKAIDIPKKTRVRCFRGMAHGVFEVLQGTSQFLSYKKSVAFLSGQTPYGEQLLPYYYKEGYEVQVKNFADIDDVKTWVNELKKDTLFVFYAEDHPVTGEIYSFVEELDRLLNEKRIFSFRVSHRQHLYRGYADLRPYTVRLCEFTPSATVAILGERFRSPVIMTSGMSWDAKSYIYEVQNVSQQRIEAKDLVEDFEKSLVPLPNSYRFSLSDRLYDRGLCAFTDVSADAVLKALRKKISEQINTEDLWGTTNLCTWDSLKVFDSWWKPAPSLEVLRGGMVFSAEALRIKDFAKLLISSYDEVRAQQSWGL